MSFQFTVTDIGLQVDKTMILPGSTLVLASPAPSHWSRFGNAGGGETLVVATPAAAVGDSDAPAVDKPRRGRPAKAAE